MRKINILVIASVLILGLLSTNAQALKDYNSSKSNTFCCTISGPLNPGALRLIVNEIEQIGPGIITERGVRQILNKRGIKGIKKIVIQRKGNKVEVLILEHPSDLPVAQKALMKGPIKPHRQ